MKQRNFFNYHEKASTKKPWLQYYLTKKEESMDTIYRKLSENFDAKSDSVVLHYSDREITAGEFFNNILAVASALIVSGIRKGDIITLAMPETPELLYLFYALNRIGAIANIVDPRTSIGEIEHVVNESKLLFTTEDAALKWKDAIKETTIKEIITISPFDSAPFRKRLKYQIESNLRKNKKNSDFTKWRSFVARNYQYHKMFETTLFVHESYYEKDQTAMMIHSEKGEQKTITLSNDDINRMTHDYLRAGFRFPSEKKCLNLIHPFLGMEMIAGIHVPLIAGTEIILKPDCNPNQLDQLLIKYKPNHIIGMPSHYQSLLQSKKMEGQNLSFVKSVIMVGEINEQLEKQINLFFKLHRCASTIKKRYEFPEALTTIVTPPHQYNSHGSIGIPLPHNTIGIFEPNTEKELDYDEIGEICMQISKPEPKHDTIKQHQDGTIWLHSKDLGYISKDGFVFIKKSEEKKIVCSDGSNVFSKRIEQAILKHQVIASCMVVGVDDLIYGSGKIPKAYITLKNDYPNIEGELEMLCKRLLPEYYQPVEFEVRETLPMTETGEPDYRTVEIEALKQQKNSLLAVVKQIGYTKK